MRRRPDEETLQSLVEMAVAVRKRAHAPYSNYLVGAALLTTKGSVHVGCNVENASYGATICAERAAVTAMVASGERHPIVCALVTGGAEPVAPCGICRQVLVEFAPDLLLVLVAVRGKQRVRRETTLGALLPEAFRLL
ncbi:MAG: cytidine deaminase [Myxococcales bacterium]|jgi:cytidine deaminase